MPLVRENESNLWPVIVVVYALYHMGNIYAEFYVCVSFNKTVTIHISICFFSWLLQKSSNSNYVSFYIWRTKTSLSDSHVWLYWNINNWGLFLSRRLVDRITCQTESPLSWLWRSHLYLLSLGRDRLNLFIKSQMWSQFTEQISFDGAQRSILCRFGADVLTLIATSHRPVFA